MKNIFFIVGLFLVWRLFLFLPLSYAQTHIPMQHDSRQYTLWAYAGKYPPVSSYFIYPWSNFDGVHYLTIAGDGGFLNPFGYQHASDGRFFPLYPLLISFTTFLIGYGLPFGPQVFFSAFFLSNFFFLLSLILFYFLIKLDFSENTALTAIILLLCFPTSFFFGATYSESLFLFLSLATFFALRKRLLLVASISAFFLVATRVVGVVIIPIVLYEMWKDDYVLIFKEKKKISIWQFLGKLIFSLLIPFGLILFALYNWYQWKDPLFFIHAQEFVGDGRSTGIVLFPQTIFRYIKILITIPHFQIQWWVSLTEFASFFFGLIFLFVAYRKKVNLGYILFSLLMFFIATENGTFSGLPRYIMVLFPIFIGFALTKNVFIKIIYAVVGLIGLFFLTAFFARGYFIA